MKIEASPAELSRRAPPLPLPLSVFTDEKAAPEPMRLELTVNGRGLSLTDVLPNELLVDFLHERDELRLTGTKLNCAIGACGACKVAVQEKEGGPFLPVLACYARMNALNGMRVTTVEHLSALVGEACAPEAEEPPLHPLQREFLREFAFQCGFCTPGFLMAAFVLMDALRRNPIPRSQLDSAIYKTFAGQLCRCTGYARYIAATRNVILATPGLLLEDKAEPPLKPFGICFRIVKRSGNDLVDRQLIGYFDSPQCEVVFEGMPSPDTCRAWLEIPISSVRTGEPIRDLNLRRFFFFDGCSFRLELETIHLLDDSALSGLIPSAPPVPAEVCGTLKFGKALLPVKSQLLIRTLDGERFHIVTRRPIEIDARDLKLPLAAFALEFGLKLLPQVEISVDVVLSYRVRV
jgi:aerobic-type carbon monoxide dehydrogenase small subunit (CoxS/CutS family)